MSSPAKPEIKLHELLRDRIDYLTRSGQTTQRQIAVACGYDAGKSQIITMIKQGLTRLPINKVGPMAKALGLDAAYLLRVVLKEYNPETWDVLQEVLGPEMLSAGERRLIEFIRDRAPYLDFYPETREDIGYITGLIDAIAERKGPRLAPAQP